MNFDKHTIADVRSVIGSYEGRVHAPGDLRQFEDRDDLTLIDMLTWLVHEWTIVELLATLDKGWLGTQPLPLQITADDIKDAALQYLFETADDFETRFANFDHFLEETSRVPRQSSPFAVGSGFFAPPLEHFSLEQNALWISENGFSVRLMGSIPLYATHEYTSPEGRTYHMTARRELYARVAGRCSNRSLLRFQEDVRDVLRFMFMILEELHLFSKPPVTTHSAIFENEVAEIAFYPWSAEVGSFLGQIFSAYYCRSTKKDSIDRRLRNAVHLLVQAGSQSHPGLALSLTVAAIEAMLCDKEEGIATQMAENVATLLEPEGRLRPAAVAFVKKLYDARSKTLHGTLLEHETTYLRNSRLLTTVVLKAVLERREFQRRMGHDTEKPEELLKELKDAKYHDGEVPGVSPCPIRDLWRERDRGKA